MEPCARPSPWPSPRRRSSTFVTDSTGRASSTTSEGSEWTYGVSRSYLQELCDYWRTTFDWRAQEAILNSFDQFQTPSSTANRIHFIHARSPNPEALPLLLVHGWPGSIFEFVKVIGPLSDPHGARRRRRPTPSTSWRRRYPGYGFSGPTIEPGWGPRRIASAFALLMERLGYGRYGAGGGDWGAIITTELARGDGGRHLCGLHLTMPLGEPPDDAQAARSSPRPTGRAWRTGRRTRPAGRSCTYRSTARGRTPSRSP